MDETPCRSISHYVVSGLKFPHTRKSVPGAVSSFTLHKGVCILRKENGSNISRLRYSLIKKFTHALNMVKHINVVDLMKYRQIESIR